MDVQELAIIVPAAAAVLIAIVNAIWQASITRKTLDHQASITQKTLDHQRTSARDERVQARIASTYEDMLDTVGWVMEIVDATQPIMEPGPKPPEEPDPERIRRVQARIGAHGSREVKAILERWVRARVAFFVDADTLQAMRALPEGVDPQIQFGVRLGEQFQKIHERRKELHGIVRELEDRVNEELRT